MAQRVENIYRLVTLPWFYNSVQIALGADAARKRYVREFVRPQPGMRLLDVGCGPATIFPYLPEMITQGSTSIQGTSNSR